MTFNNVSEDIKIYDSKITTICHMIFSSICKIYCFFWSWVWMPRSNKYVLLTYRLLCIRNISSSWQRRNNHSFDIDKKKKTTKFFICFFFDNISINTLIILFYVQIRNCRLICFCLLLMSSSTPPNRRIGQ